MRDDKTNNEIVCLTKVFMDVFNLSSQNNEGLLLGLLFKFGEFFKGVLNIS